MSNATSIISPRRKLLCAFGATENRPSSLWAALPRRGATGHSPTVASSSRWSEGNLAGGRDNGMAGGSLPVGGGAAWRATAAGIAETCGDGPSAACICVRYAAGGLSRRHHFMRVGRSRPTPFRWANSLYNRPVSARGNGGDRIEAMLERRCALLPVPNSTMSTPGSCRAKR